MASSPVQQSELDKIISKYQKKTKKSTNQTPYKFQLQSTKKKSETRSIVDKEKKDQHMITFMNNSLTPSKQIDSIYSYTDRSMRSNQQNNLINNIKMNNQEASTLRHLDEAEKKLAISQRNYAQSCRKLQKLRIHTDELTIELQKERKSRLQQLIDIQNKFTLLEAENEKNTELLRAKDNTIAIYQERLIQKEQQIIVFQKQIQQISYKLCSTLQMRQNEQIKFLQKSHSLIQEEKSYTLLKFKQKYQNDIKKFHEQVNNFQMLLIEKQKQKKEALIKIEQMAHNHQLELREVRNALIVNEQNYRKWLDEAKQEKLQTIENYQSQIRQLRMIGLKSKQDNQATKMEELSYNRRGLEDLKHQLVKSQASEKQISLKLQKSEYQKQSLERKNRKLEEQIQLLKKQYVQQLQENKKAMQILEQRQRQSQKIKEKICQIELQRQQSFNDNTLLAQEIKQLQETNIILKAKLQNKGVNSQINKNVLTDRTAEEININSTLAQTIIKLKASIQKHEEDKQALTKDLFAQRLETAKLKQELNETKIQLKRQYQLSLENTKQQLLQQMKHNRGQAFGGDFEKQRLYLEMFELERKYELLKSEVVTVNEMSRLVNKSQKYYSKKK